MQGDDNVVIGKKAPKEKLLPELQECRIPNDRKHLGEIVMEGKFENKITVT